MPRLHRLRVLPVLALAAALSACVAQRLAERPDLGPPVLAPASLKTLGPAPVKGTEARFAIAPVTNVPGEFMFAVEDSLKAYALTRDLALVSEGDPSATYRVKGYLSAIGDSHRVLLVYVWDVFDAAGNRVHRVSGQQAAPGGSADPWSAVDKTMIDTAARETIDALTDWVRG